MFTQGVKMNFKVKELLKDRVDFAIEKDDNCDGEMLMVRGY